MSQRKWIRGTICGVDNCRSTRFTSVAGQTLCQYGHVKEGDVEIDDDGDDNFVMTKRLNIRLSEHGTAIGSQRDASVAKAGSQREFGKNGRIVSYRCFQVLLKKQVTLIIHALFPSIPDKKEFEENVLALCKTYWLKFLQFTMKTANNSTADGYQHPTYLDVFAIIYLAFFQLNHYQVYTSDIMSLIRTGKIPFTKSLHLIPKDLAARLPGFFFRTIEPRNLPSDDKFYLTIMAMTDKISFRPHRDLMIHNYYHFVFRTLTEFLLLPNAAEMFVLMFRLTERFPSLQRLQLDFTNPKVNLPTKITLFPEVRLALLMIFTIKLYFRTDTSHSRSSPPKVNHSRWLKAMDDYDSFAEIPFLDPPTPQQMLDCPDDKVKQYLNWVYHNVITKSKKSGDFTDESFEAAPGVEEELSELSIVDKRLFQIFNVEDSSSMKPENAPLTRMSDSTEAETRTQQVSPSAYYMNTLAIASDKSHIKEPLKSSKILRIEDKLLERFSNHLHVNEPLLRRGYKALENEIAKLASVKQHVKQNVKQKAKQKAKQKVKQDINQDDNQDINQDYNQDVKQDVKDVK